MQQQHAWKLRGDDVDWLVSREVMDRIFYAREESWGVKEIGARRQRGRGEALDGEGDAVAREQQPHKDQ